MDVPGGGETSAGGGTVTVLRQNAPKHVARPDCTGVPKSILQGLLGAVTELGAEPEQILKEAGSSASLRRLLAEDVATVERNLFLRASRTCHEYLRLYIERTERGSCLTTGQLALLGKCLVGCGDLREALATTAQFFDLLDGRIGGIALTVSGQQARLRVATVVSRASHAALALDLCNIALLHKLFEWLVDAALPLEAAQFVHARPRRPALHLTLLCCPARFGAPETALLFPASCLEMPVIRRPSELNVLLEGFPFSLLAGLSQSTSLAEHIYRAMIDAQVRLRRVPAVDEVARLFGVTGWTLRRRLAEENTSYSDIRKRVQLSIATEFLRRSDLTINQVADLANFSDAGAFRRAFQQWTGRSPSAYREHVLQA